LPFVCVTMRKIIIIICTSEERGGTDAVVAVATASNCVHRTFSWYTTVQVTHDPLQLVLD